MTFPGIMDQPVAGGSEQTKNILMRHGLQGHAGGRLYHEGKPDEKDRPEENDSQMQKAVLAGVKTEARPPGDFRNNPEVVPLRGEDRVNFLFLQSSRPWPRCTTGC